MRFCLTICTAGIIFIGYIQPKFSKVKLELVDRLVSFQKGQEKHIKESREIQYACALEMFYQSPIVGTSYIDCTGEYPHNLIIEVLMSTGVTWRYSISNLLVFYR